MRASGPDPTATLAFIDSPSAAMGQLLGNLVEPGANGTDGPVFLTVIPEPAGLAILVVAIEVARAMRGL